MACSKCKRQRLAREASAKQKLVKKKSSSSTGASNIITPPELMFKVCEGCKFSSKISTKNGYKMSCKVDGRGFTAISESKTCPKGEFKDLNLG